jgi:CheY-like chemotaxis protein
MSRTASEPKHVLIVDDEEALAWSLASRLTKVRPNHRVTTANDGNTALALMSEHGVDLLIADIRMPGMSGIELILSARNDRPELPVVVMTAFASADVQKLTAGPFTGFLEKPFEFDRLLELVDTALEPPKVGFSGAISVQTLPDIVQLYALSCATGSLHIKHHSDEGQVWFEQGAIVHAATGEQVGDDAFYEIMMWSGGDFSMRAGARAPARSVRSNWQELLMESCRRIDELRRWEPPSRTGWTQAPPPPSGELSELDGLFQDFEPPAAADVAAFDSQETEARQPPLEVTMNIKDSLAKLNSIDGFVGAALVDSESGMLLGQEGGGALNMEIAAAGNTEVVRSKRKVMGNLALKDTIEDILITLGKQYHLIRPLRARSTLFFYVALDRSRANLAMARIALADVEKDLAV